MKKLSIQISSSKTMLDFEIEEYSGKQYVYKITYGNTWGNKIRTKIGEAKSIDDAITIAKASISGNIIGTNLE